ncbi:preprotein translocase subunit SecE [Candidatus Saccharibacteria bacterium RIFCSPHIGHO2_12_FULL_41_12]|nr:MAG: preprotein translocase subunit SecE [Candidatus Saccharibacteria bacterium RIFCSPHIGHO2_12_FULL_41_12]
MAKAKIRVSRKKESSKSVREISSGKKSSFKRPKIKIPAKLKQLKSFMGKSYHLPLPDNRVNNILSKRVRLVPNYLKNSFTELKLVEWPNRRLTISLSFAVMIFAIVFGLFVAFLDYGLDKIFKEVFIKK